MATNAALESDQGLAADNQIGGESGEIDGSRQGLEPLPQGRQRIVDLSAALPPTVSKMSQARIGEGADMDSGWIVAVGLMALGGLAALSRSGIKTWVSTTVEKSVTAKSRKSLKVCGAI